MDYDPRWYVVPRAFTVLAVIAALPTWFIVIGVGLYDCYSLSCASSDGHVPVWAAILALLCVGLTWTWPRRYAFESARWLFGIFAVILVCTAIGRSLSS
ncbi:hypothetical protein ACFOVU_20835 [Nocardiopsis sediminis]|uniref:Uncharacterized protein n=1 Tax=Nocardiopsis sediminis TaxID=1778267 RepID=A0ABV8FSL3_9ACTN